jgi:hypothetical protein
MKKSYFVVALVLSLVLALQASLVSAQNGPTSYTSGFQIQNLSTENGTVTIKFYSKADGSEVASVNDTITASGALNYFPIDAINSGFDGSVVIQSDVNVAAIVNVFGDGGTFGGGSYGGFSNGATTVNIPLLIKNLQGAGTLINTYFYVQNAGTADATVSVSYGDGTCTDSATIKAGASAQFDQATDSCLPNSFVDAATITSNEPIVASVIQYDKDSLLANNGFAGGTAASTTPVMPLIINNFVDTFTGIQIQNVGDVDTEVTLTYLPSPGNPGAECTETQTIPSRQSGNFGLGYITDNCEASGVTGFVGAAKVTANSESTGLVAIVNQVNLFGAGNNPGNASAYAAFAPENATNVLAMPVIVEDLSLGANGSLFTGFNIYNAGDAEVSVNCAYVGTANGSAVNSSVTITVPAGTANNIVNTGAGGLDNGFVGSATCTGPTGAKLVAVANQVGGAGDSLYTYEAFNQ